MTIQQRQAMWIDTHGTVYERRRAALYVQHQSPTTVAALEVLFRKVCAR